MSDDLLSKAVRDRFAHTQQVTALVGSQIYPDVLQQGSPLPAVVVFITASNCEEDLNNSDRLFHPSVNTLVFANDRAAANSVQKAIRDYALPADMQGLYEGMWFKEVTLSNGPIELVDYPRDGSDAWRKVTQQTFTIWAVPDDS